MAEVGVLNLTIKENSGQAVTGLGNLADALGRVKDAVKGASLTSFSNRLSKLADTINKEFNSSTIGKIQELGDQLSKMSGAGNITIRIKNVGSITKASEAAAKVNEATKALQTGTSGTSKIMEGFSTAGKSIQQVTDEFMNMRNVMSNGAVKEVAQVMEQFDMSKLDMKDFISDPITSLKDRYQFMGKAAEDYKSNISAVIPALRNYRDTVMQLESKRDIAGFSKKTGEELISGMKEASTEIKDVVDSTPVYQSLEEGAQAMGISVEEATRLCESNLQALRNSTGEVRVFSSIEEAAQAMGISVEEATNMAASALANLNAQGNAPSFENYTMNMSALDAEFGNLAQSEDVATSATERLKNALGTLSSIGRSAGRGISSLWNELREGAQNLHVPLSGLVKQFGRLAKMRMMRAAIKMISQGLSEGVGNVYKYSQAMGTSFSTAMDSAASSIQQVKNSVGAAIAPAIQAVIPLFIQLAGVAIDALNAVNQLFALLGGATSWTKAVYPTAQAFNDMNKAAKGAGGSAKEMLADFDELNVIASQGGGGGGAASGLETSFEDMFEQMSEFDDKIKSIVDFVKDNFDGIKRAAFDIGAAILGWKISKAFAGTLGTLGALLAAGAVMDFTWRMTAMFDKQYLKTGDEGWLVADAITNAVGATLAGTLVGSVLGTGWGLVTAGFTLLISGAISYGIAMANADNENAELLKKIGLIKAAIGDLLIAAGFYVATGSVWAAVGAALFAVPLFYAVATIVATIETAKNEQAIAKEFFKNSGKGGISVQKLFEEVNKEFERLAAPYTVTLEVFSKHQDVIDRMKEQLNVLTGLNSVITSDQTLTVEQAKNFKEAWGLVFDAFREANTIEWDTIMSGFNAAMQTQNESLKEQAKEQRIIALQIEKGLDEIEAQLVDRMNELVDKIITNTATEEEIEEYKKKMEGFGLVADQTIQTFKDMLESAKLIDFSDEDNAVQAAVEFIKNTSQAYKETIDSIDLGLKDQLAAIDAQKERINNLVKAGVLDSDTAEAWKSNLDAMAQTFKDAAEEKKKSVANAMTESFKLLLNTAKEGLKNYIDENGGIDFEGASTYVDSVIGPIIKELRDSGADVETVVNEVFDFGGLLLDSLEIGSGDYNELVSFLIGELGGILKDAGSKVDLGNNFIQRLFNTINWDMGLQDQQEITKNLVEAFGFDSAIASLKDYYNLDVSDFFEIFGWEGLESEQRKSILAALEGIFGKETVENVLKQYGVDANTYIAEGLGNKTEIINALQGIEDTLVKGGLTSQYILDNWDLYAPAIGGKTTEEALEIIKTVIKTAGTDSKLILENWNLIAPTVEEYGLENSLTMIKDVASTSGLDIETVISNWDLIAPIVEDNGITKSLAQIKDVASKSGVDTRTILEHWNLIAPLVDQYGITASMNSIKRLAQAAGVDVDTILDNWDLYAPLVMSQGLENSLNYLTKLMQTTGHDSEYILQHWDLVAPTVNHLGFDNTIAAIKQISKTSGVDIKSIVANWNLIAPLIDENNVDKSVDEIGKTIKDNESNWQQILKGKLETSKVTTPTDFVSEAQQKVAEAASSLQAAAKAYSIVFPVGVKSDGSSVSTSVHDTKEGGKYIALNNNPGYVFAEGGFPLKGSIFVANEAGPEMVGKIGSRSAVANTEQIVSGIAIGVSEANSEQNALLIEQNNLLRQILRKDNSVRIGASAALGRVAKQSIEMYGTVGG